MPVAAISDIHGNLPALEAVLADVERDGLEKIVVVGDTVSGPWPAEVFDLLDATGAIHVRGNADRLALSGGEGAIGDWSARPPRRPSNCGRCVAADARARGRRARARARLPCDANLGRADLHRVTPDEDVASLFEGSDVDVVVCGHTHVQYDRTLSTGLRVVNPGSVGMPYEGRRGAFWAVLGPDVEFRSTQYDVEAAAAAMREHGAPNVEDQLIGYLLEPPDPHATTEYFESLRAS